MKRLLSTTTKVNERKDQVYFANSMFKIDRLIYPQLILDGYRKSLMDMSNEIRETGKGSQDKLDIVENFADYLFKSRHLVDLFYLIVMSQTKQHFGPKNVSDKVLSSCQQQIAIQSFDFLKSFPTKRSFDQYGVDTNDPEGSWFKAWPHSLFNIGSHVEMVRNCMNFTAQPSSDDKNKDEKSIQKQNLIGYLEDAHVVWARHLEYLLLSETFGFRNGTKEKPFLFAYPTDLPIFLSNHGLEPSNLIESDNVNPSIKYIPAKSKKVPNQEPDLTESKVYFDSNLLSSPTSPFKVDPSFPKLEELDYENYYVSVKQYKGEKHDLKSLIQKVRIDLGDQSSSINDAAITRAAALTSWTTSSLTMENEKEMISLVSNALATKIPNSPIYYLMEIYKTNRQSMGFKPTVSNPQQQQQ